MGARVLVVVFAVSVLTAALALDLNFLAGAFGGVLISGALRDAGVSDFLRRHVRRRWLLWLWRHA